MLGGNAPASVVDEAVAMRGLDQCPAAIINVAAGYVSTLARMYLETHSRSYGSAYGELRTLAMPVFRFPEIVLFGQGSFRLTLPSFR